MNEAVNPRAIMGGNSPPLAELLAIEEAGLVAEVEAIALRANDLRAKVKEASPDDASAAFREDSPHFVEAAGLIRDASALSKRVEARRVEVKAPWLQGEKTVDGFFGPHRDRAGKIAEVYEKALRDAREKVRQEAARLAAEEARRKQQEEAERRRAADAEAKRLADEAKRLQDEADAAAAKGRERTAALARDKATEAAAQAASAAEEAAKPVVEASPVVEPAIAVQTAKTEVADGLAMTTKGEWKGTIVDIASLDLAVLRPYLKPDHLAVALNQAVRMGVRACRGAEIKLVEKLGFR